MNDEPIELIALDTPDDGLISARRQGEDSFVFVQGLGDAIMAALARNVDLIVPRALYESIRDDLPSVLPPYIKVR